MFCDVLVAVVVVVCLSSLVLHTDRNYFLHYYLSPQAGLGMRRKLRSTFFRSEGRYRVYFPLQVNLIPGVLPYLNRGRWKTLGTRVNRVSTKPQTKRQSIIYFKLSTKTYELKRLTETFKLTLECNIMCNVILYSSCQLRLAKKATSQLGVYSSLFLH